MKKISACTIAFLFTAFFAPVSPTPAFAESTGSITILQEGIGLSPVGDWTLIRPDRTKLELNGHKEYNNSDAETGFYSLLIERPEGAGSTIKLFVNGEEVSSSETPQISFTLESGDEILIQASFKYTRVGTVSVSSKPSGILFTLTGPNNLRERGTTPESFQDMPEGMYSVTYDVPTECPKVHAKSDRLIEGGRIGFDIKIACESLDLAEDEEYEKQLKYVTLQQGKDTIVFEDVLMEEWFAPYVFSILKTGVMSGFKDENGNLTGRFGPGENVTLAQLAKIAHTLTGLNPSEAQGDVQNARARGTWFEDYYRSAEQNAWRVYLNTSDDPSRPATRAEVVATLLQALDVQREWAKGEIFTDVAPTTAYAASVETAAIAGVVSGTSGEKFSPKAPITRAAMAKVLALSVEVFIEDSPEIRGDNY